MKIPMRPRVVEASSHRSHRRDSSTKASLRAPNHVREHRNGTDDDESPSRDVPLHGAALDIPALAERFARNPRELALLRVELDRRGGLSSTSKTALDNRSTQRSRCPSCGGWKKTKKKRWEVKEEHRRFAAEMIPLMPDREGVLLVVHIGTPTHVGREQLHERFGAFCDDAGFSYVTILDWGEEATDPARLPDKGNGEHQHAIVWCPDRKAFGAALFEWADALRIERRSVRLKAVTGWYEFVDTGSTRLLQTHIARVAAYPTKPPEDGRVRDLRRHTRAGGIFIGPWNRFVRYAAVRTPRSVTRYCVRCCNPLSRSATKRREFCSDACRLSVWRDPTRRVPKRGWIVRRVRRDEPPALRRASRARSPD